MAETVVLVVDRDEPTRLDTASFIREELPESSVLTANSFATATDALENQSIDVVVTGYNLDGGNGLELAEWMREQSPATGSILYTEAENLDTESFEDVVVEFLGKETPNAKENLLALIEQTGPEQTQAAYPVTETEPQRLEATEAVIESCGRIRPTFERIASLAVEHFDADTAAVTFLLRDRQEVVVTAGQLPIPTVREESLATHTLVTEGDVMAVEDTRTDPRFGETEAIHSANIRSYLGAVIENPDGYAVGTLSVYDDTARTFSADDRTYITQLAGVVRDLLILADGGDPL